MRRWPVGAGRGRAAVDIEDVVLAAVGMEMGRQHAAVAGAACRRRVQHHRAGAVAEQHAGAAVVPVEDAREGLGADHQRGARLPERGSKLSATASAKMKPEHTACTSKAAPRCHAELRLDLGRGRREGLVGGRGREHDQVEVAAAHARRAASAALRPRRRRGRRSARPSAAMWRWPMPVRWRIHSSEVSSRLRQLVVGDDPLRQIGAAADDLRAQIIIERSQPPAAAPAPAPR